MSSQQTENNNTLLGLPDECKLNIFRFFSKQCAANVSATCRDLYALSNDKSISPEKLPYATLDYFKQMTSGSFKMKSIGEVSAVVSLSDDKIAVAASSHTYILQLTRIGQVKCLAKLTVGGGLALRSLCCLGSNRLGAVDIMFNKYVLDLDKIPPRYYSDTMTETSQKDFLKTI